ncbi:MAG: flagellar motor protein MotB, partial [Chloroflexota bacterium]
MARQRASLGRSRAEGKENSERWLLTYADMITLLLAFFVVMFALSNQDLRKYAQLAKSIQQAFSFGQIKDQITVIDLGGSRTGTQPGFSELSQMVAFDNIKSSLQSFSDEEGFSGEISATETRDGLAIRLSGDLLFPSAKAMLKPDSLRALDKVAELVSRLPNSIRVEGHTDDIPPPSGEFPTNWELSTARATNVLRYLAEFGGIAPERLTAAGWGENKPIESNYTP